ncbi:MAG: RluA family pseudouridine synthase [Clostridia bacterium]
MINKLKLKSAILVNLKPEFVNYILHIGDSIVVKLDSVIKDKAKMDNSFLNKFSPSNLPLDILYEDDYLLIISKIAGIAIHPSFNNYENTLSNAVAPYLAKQNIGSIHILTRLDKNTSGVCIFAKNEYIQELFNRKKDSICMQKEYICLVDGIMEKDHDIILTNIARKPDSIITREINKKGLYAKTEYFTLKRSISKNISLLKVILHTGRTHQIRVHLASISHVLLGDSLYSQEYGIDAKYISKYITRQALHAIKISFKHPITGVDISVISNIPYDMQCIIDEM